MKAISLPTREIQHFRNAARVIFHKPKENTDDRTPGRGFHSTQVTEYSPRTAMRMGLHLSEFGNLYSHEITLTWPKQFPINGELVRVVRKKILRKLKSYGVEEYTWALEFQKRGAPHIHLLVDRFVDHKWLGQSWFDIVGSGDPKHLKAGTEVNEIRDMTLTRIYLYSYAKKKDQKQVPEEYSNCGRFWDSNRSIKPHEIEECEYTDTREMNRESRNITRWRKATKRKIEAESGRKYPKWKIRNGKGFLAWGETEQLRNTLDRLKPQADDSVPF